MPAIDHGFKMIARTTGRALARVAGVDCDDWKPIESTLQATTERLADRVFQARHGPEKFVVYMEFATTWNRAIPWSLLNKSALLAERERLPVINLLYILSRRGYTRQEGTLKLSVANRPTQQVWFEEIKLWEVKPETWWDNEPGLMAILPLFRNQQPAEVVVSHAARRIEVAEIDSARKADYLSILGFMGKLAFPLLDIVKLIGRTNMEESPFYAEVMQFGAVNARRDDTLRILAKRFGARPAAKVRKLMTPIENIDDLDRLFYLALDCESINQFKEQIAG